jgi:hypothetical protein
MRVIKTVDRNPSCGIVIGVPAGRGGPSTGERGGRNLFFYQRDTEVIPGNIIAQTIVSKQEAP